MEPSFEAVQRICDVYDRLVREHESRAEWTAAERAVWDVVTARTQKDMGGVASVFTDALEVPGRFGDTLRDLGRADLAAAWDEASAALERRGFLRDGRWTGRPDERFERVFDRLDARIDDALVARLDAASGTAPPQ